MLLLLIYAARLPLVQECRVNFMRSFDPDQEFRPIFRKHPEIESIVASPESCALMRDMTQLGFPALDALNHVPAFMELNCRVSRIEPTGTRSFWCLATAS